MKKISFILSFLVISMGVFAQTTWKADPYHSKLGFTVTHLGIADVPGDFEKFDVTVTSSKPDCSDAVVELTTDVNSIKTRVKPRDKHCRSSDLFNFIKITTMHFISNSIGKIDTNKYCLTGNLTIHGVT